MEEEYNQEDMRFSTPSESMRQFEDMTIGQLKKLTEDFKRVSGELEYVKRKYPKAKEELEGEDFDLDKFLEDC